MLNTTKTKDDLFIVKMNKNDSDSDNEFPINHIME